jgi:hypothetical protein
MYINVFITRQSIVRNPVSHSGILKLKSRTKTNLRGFPLIFSAFQENVGVFLELGHDSSLSYTLQFIIH